VRIWGIFAGDYEMVDVGDMSDAVSSCLFSCSIFGRAFWVYHQKRISFFFLTVDFLRQPFFQLVECFAAMADLVLLAFVHFSICLTFILET
jgi:hypothetical protein